MRCHLRRWRASPLLLLLVLVVAQMAREALGPLLDAACARLGFVLRRAFEIAAERTITAGGGRGRGGCRCLPCARAP